MISGNQKGAIEIEAIVFDLYGTLLRINLPVIHRGIPRAMEVDARPWMELVRKHLLTSSFSSRAELVRFICDTLVPEHAAHVEETCMAVVERELASIESMPGVFSVLGFLKKRGYTLGLISNLTSVHKEPVHRLGLGEYFDATCFSCDEGVCKPDPSIYLELCRRLDVEPRSVLVVGDSYRNDVLAPQQLGMQVLPVTRFGRGRSLTGVNELGWSSLDEEDFKPLIADGDRVELGASRGILREFRPLPDDGQGRYNLVASAEVEQKGRDDAVHSERDTVFCKRYLFPEAAHVEVLAHQMLGAVGLPSCNVFVPPGPEPVLVVSKAPGRKLTGSVDIDLAYELGRHCAAAYIFANADLRPRNAFVDYDGTKPVVTMVDLEHCFFNLALDLDGLEEPFRPQTFDRLSQSEITDRVRRRVLSERTTRRAMRTFLTIESEESGTGRAFKEGWVALYRRVQDDRERLCRRMEERIYQEPYLIIGTRAYRRAMARLDVLDTRGRIDLDAEAIFPRLAAFKRQD